MCLQTVHMEPSTSSSSSSVWSLQVMRLQPEWIRKVSPQELYSILTKQFPRKPYQGSISIFICIYWPNRTCHTGRFTIDVFACFSTRMHAYLRMSFLPLEIHATFSEHMLGSPQRNAIGGSSITRPRFIPAVILSKDVFFITRTRLQNWQNGKNVTWIGLSEQFHCWKFSMCVSMYSQFVYLSITKKCSGFYFCVECNHIM